jgi:hypothetical protein
VIFPVVDEFSGSSADYSKITLTSIGQAMGWDRREIRECHISHLNPALVMMMNLLNLKHC